MVPFRLGPRTDGPAAEAPGDAKLSKILFWVRGRRAGSRSGCRCPATPPRRPRQRHRSSTLNHALVLMCSTAWPEPGAHLAVLHAASVIHTHTHTHTPPVWGTAHTAALPPLPPPPRAVGCGQASCPLEQLHCTAAIWISKLCAACNCAAAGGRPGHLHVFTQSHRSQMLLHGWSALVQQGVPSCQPIRCALSLDRWRPACSCSDRRHGVVPSTPPPQRAHSGRLPAML